MAMTTWRRHGLSASTLSPHSHTATAAAMAISRMTGPLAARLARKESTAGMEIRSGEGGSGPGGRLVEQDVPDDQQQQQQAAGHDRQRPHPAQVLAAADGHRADTVRRQACADRAAAR